MLAGKLEMKDIRAANETNSEAAKPVQTTNVPAVDLLKLVRDSFPKNPHEEQTQAIHGEPSDAWMNEAHRQGWQWVAYSSDGMRFMYLPNV